MVSSMEFHQQSRLGADQMRAARPFAVLIQFESKMGIAGVEQGKVRAVERWSARYASQTSFVLLGSVILLFQSF